MVVSGTATSYAYMLTTRPGVGLGFFISGELSSLLGWRSSFFAMATSPTVVEASNQALAAVLADLVPWILKTPSKTS
jgi:hypothetical protein